MHFFSLKRSVPQSPVSDVITFLYSEVLAYGYYLIGCQKSLKFILKWYLVQIIHVGMNI